jgi:hypothetical protein
MKTNNTTLKARNTSVMAGIDKHITTSITINGTAFTQADLKAVFESQVTAITTNEALHKSLADGVVNARAIGVKVNTMYQLLRSALRGRAHRVTDGVDERFIRWARVVRSLLAGAFAVVAPRPAAGPTLAFLELLLGSANAAFSGHRLLGILDPADELVAGERRDGLPGTERRRVGDQRFAQVFRKFVHHPTGHSLAAR